MGLLTGDRFYSTSDAALREAILNAIDACGRRNAEAPDFKPAIGVTFDEASLSIAIQDNGDGMDKRDITDLFAKIGSSASRVIGHADDAEYEAFFKGY